MQYDTNMSAARHSNRCESNQISFYVRFYLLPLADKTESNVIK